MSDPDLLKRLRDALAKAAGQYGPITGGERNTWEGLINEADAALAMGGDLEFTQGPWTYEWVPDGDDPGVGNLTIVSSWGGDHVLMQTTRDDVQRDEWDAVVRGATL